MCNIFDAKSSSVLNDDVANYGPLFAIDKQVWMNAVNIFQSYNSVKFAWIQLEAQCSIEVSDVYFSVRFVTKAAINEIG